MKTRSSVEIVAPAFIFAAFSLFSVPTLVIAVVWMTVGVCVIGYRTLEEFPTDGISWRWLRGRRRGVVHFYHLACWPRYVTIELRNIRLPVGHRLSRRPLPSTPPAVASRQNDDERT